MSRQDQYLRALRNQPFDRLTWAPNFDYWLGVNRRLGRLPVMYRDMSRNDLVRAVGGTIWSRVSSVKVDLAGIDGRREEVGPGRWRQYWQTPVGTLTALHVRQGGLDESEVLHEHSVKTVDDLPALKALILARQFTVDTSAAQEQLHDVGQDGVVIDCCPCVPFIEFGKIAAGWETGLLLWHDHRAAVEEVLEAYEWAHLEQIRLTAGQSPCPVVHLGDNMDQLMVSPDLFRRYALPFYGKAAQIVHAAGKLLQVHWCGRTAKLLPLLPGSGVDCAEAIVTAPMSDLTVEAALSAVDGQVVIQGGVPSVLMCPQGGSRDSLEGYVRHIVDEIHPTRSFALGMGDNVPPDADFDRVRLISDLVAEAYGQA